MLKCALYIIHAINFQLSPISTNICFDQLWTDDQIWAAKGRNLSNEPTFDQIEEQQISK